MFSNSSKTGSQGQGSMRETFNQLTQTMKDQGYDIGDLQTQEERASVCRAKSNATFTHNSTGNWLAVPLAAEDYDSDGMHDLVMSNTRITFVVGGVYLITGELTFTTNTTGYRAAAFSLNGGAVGTYFGLMRVINDGASNWVRITTTTQYKVSAGDYIELMAWQDSGGNLDVLDAAFAVARVK